MRYFGPIEECSIQEISAIVNALAGANLLVPGVYVSQGGKTDPVSVSIKKYDATDPVWQKEYHPDEFNIKQIIRDVAMGIEKIIDGVVYEPNGDYLIDYRQTGNLSVVEQHIQTTGVNFGINLMSDDRNIQSVIAWAREENGGTWLWGCDVLGLSGTGESMVSCIQKAKNTILSWWISYGKMVITQLDEK